MRTNSFLLISLNEETHTYTLENSDISFSSVTEFIGSFFQPFDENKIALKSKFPSAILVLDNKTILRGIGLGYQGEATGEVCFNTSLTGYQEIISDPSYAGQI